MNADLPIEPLRNLGHKSGQWPREVVADLEWLGPVIAYRLVKQRQPKASLNLLWPLAAGLKFIVVGSRCRRDARSRLR